MTHSLSGQSAETRSGHSFEYPKGLKLRYSAKSWPPGVSVLADGESCPIPASGGSKWLNPWAEIEAVPVLVETACLRKP